MGFLRGTSSSGGRSKTKGLTALLPSSDDAEELLTGTPGLDETSYFQPSPPGSSGDHPGGGSQLELGVRHSLPRSLLTSLSVALDGASPSAGRRSGRLIIG